MKASAVIPWRGGDPAREAALRWTVRRLPVERAIVAEISGDGPWCKAEAVMPALELLPAGLVVVHDADVWCPTLARAGLAVEAGAAEWAMPHRVVQRLSEEATAEVLAGAEPDRLMPTARDPYDGRWGGGIVVAHRDTFLDVPLDRRFRGWGQEDTSWALALHTLCGPGWRGDEPLYHLWHPPAERWTGKRGSPESWRLFREYRQARYAGPEEMRKVLEEA